MKLKDLIILCLMVTNCIGPCNTMTVQSINELQALLNVYKEVLVEKETSETQQQKPKQQKLPVIKSEDSQICGRKIREIYLKCKNQTTAGETSDCDKRYSENYPVCYFGNSILPGTSNGDKSCAKTCLGYMDNCLLHSNKLEIYLCMGARDRCMQQCSERDQGDENGIERRREETEDIQNRIVSKRVSCKLECNANYKTCKTWGDFGKVCDAAKLVCNNNCRKAFNQ